MLSMGGDGLTQVTESDTRLHLSNGFEQALQQDKLLEIKVQTHLAEACCRHRCGKDARCCGCL